MEFVELEREEEIKQQLEQDVVVKPLQDDRARLKSNFKEKTKTLIITIAYYIIFHLENATFQREDAIALNKKGFNSKSKKII